MNSRPVLFSLLILWSLSSSAQDRLITCSSERNRDNSYSIFSDSRAFAAYTVKLTFSSIEGYSVAYSTLIHGIELITVQSGRREICKLIPRPGTTNSFSYSYQYYPGKALRKAPDSSFIYLLPATAGQHLRVSRVSSLAERLGQKKTQEFYSTGFVYEMGDTICAARAGTIYNCNDAVKEGEKTNDFYKDSRNKISVEHQDGSLCTYSFLAPIQLLVGVGDYVYPGKPMAVFNKQSDKYIMMLSTFYLEEERLLDENRDINSPSCFVLIPTHFYAGDNKENSLEVNQQYTVQHPLNIITAEMSKKEKKKMGITTSN